MDIEKIGTFIAEKRKSKNLTQKEIAQTLCVTDRAVSKWERGKGLPDVSLMLPLCAILEITLQELLSGEDIEKQNLKTKAEEQVMQLLLEKQENKKKVWLAAGTGIVGICVLLASIMLSAYVFVSLWAKLTAIFFGLLIMAVCFIMTIVIDRDAGSYECPHCKKTFVPDMKTYTGSLQTFTKRKMICPHCGERNWCKRKLSKP